MNRFASIRTFIAGLIAGASVSMLLPSVLAGSGGISGAKPCPADIAPYPGGDGVVNVDDLLAVINAWGDCQPPPPPCDPSGTWVNAVAPAYSCAFGIINFNIPQWTFSQSGTNLSVSGTGLGFTMTGPVASCEAGNSFTVSKFLAGSSCNETYTLSGTFNSANQFSGTFTAGYTQSSPNGCFDCTTQTFNITATRQ